MALPHLMIQQNAVELIFPVVIKDAIGMMNILIGISPYTKLTLHMNVKKGTYLHIICNVIYIIQNSIGCNRNMVTLNVTHAILIDQYCPSRYVFEIYQAEPNVSVNFGLIVNETNTFTMTCAAWASWSPPKVPKCIREDTSLIHIKTSYDC